MTTTYPAGSIGTHQGSRRLSISEMDARCDALARMIQDGQPFEFFHQTMLMQNDGPGVILDAPAKVNLFLEVLHRRPDGYHELTSVMLAIGLVDRIGIRETRTGGVRLKCNDPGLSSGRDNLIVRAAELVCNRFEIRQGVELTLEKRIPVQAGLAGGSSDAAATLAGLNHIWKLGLSTQELMALGSELGSDCAFFLRDCPLAWCTGRGEIVEPIPLGKPLHLVLIKPGSGLATAEVFRNISVPAIPVDGQAIREGLREGDLEKIGRSLHNRLQEAAERLCPEVGQILDRLAQLKPAGQMMTGSGSTVYAVCHDLPEAQRIAREMNSFQDEQAQSRVFVVQSCD